MEIHNKRNTFLLLSIPWIQFQVSWEKCVKICIGLSPAKEQKHCVQKIFKIKNRERGKNFIFFLDWKSVHKWIGDLISRFKFLWSSLCEKNILRKLWHFTRVYLKEQPTSWLNKYLGITYKGTWLNQFDMRKKSF